MKIQNDLDWLHVAIANLKWRCTKRTAPRTWELGLHYRHIPPRGESSIDAIAIEAGETDWASLKTGRSAHVKGEFRKCRDFLHAVVISAASTGAINGRKYRALTPPIPIPAMSTEDLTKREFLDAFELYEPEEDRPDSWVLRDKETGAMVEFKLNPDADLADRRKAVQDALNRIEAMNRRNAQVRRHVLSPSSASRVN